MCTWKYWSKMRRGKFGMEATSIYKITPQYVFAQFQLCIDFSSMRKWYDKCCSTQHTYLAPFSIVSSFLLSGIHSSIIQYIAETIATYIWQFDTAHQQFIEIFSSLSWRLDFFNGETHGSPCSTIPVSCIY